MIGAKRRAPPPLPRDSRCYPAKRVMDDAAGRRRATAIATQTAAQGICFDSSRGAVMPDSAILPRSGQAELNAVTRSSAHFSTSLRDVWTFPVGRQDRAGLSSAHDLRCSHRIHTMPAASHSERAPSPVRTSADGCGRIRTVPHRSSSRACAWQKSWSSSPS